MILVTGAAGKTGRAVIRALAGRGQAVRALVHRAEQAGPATGCGAAEVVAGDMRDPAVLLAAACGARAVYHICPNVSPDELSIGRAAIRAAREAGVEHLVYHSVLHPQVEAMPHHWLKMRVEEQLFESGLPYTILQPAVYMQNVLAHWDRIVTEGLYPVPYAAATRLGMVDLEDVAHAGALVLTEPGHAGAVYELAGPEVLTQAEVAACLERELARPVRVEVTSRAAWEEQARAAGLADYQVAALLRMFDYYEQHGFWGSPRVLAWLLGRPPATLSDVVRRSISPLPQREREPESFSPRPLRETPVPEAERPVRCRQAQGVGGVGGEGESPGDYHAIRDR